MDAMVVIGGQGRLVIPAEIRQTLGLAPGDRLLLRVEDGRLVLERPEQAAAQLRGMAGRAAGRRSLVEELLADRRAEHAAS